MSVPAIPAAAPLPRRALVWCAVPPSPFAVAGVPLWRRAVGTAMRAGFDDILVVVAGPSEELARAIARDAGERRVEVVSSSSGWANRLGDGAARWVVLQEQWVVEPEFLAALAKSEQGIVAASPDGPFATSAADIARWARDGWRPAHAPLVPVESLFDRPAVYVRVTDAASAAAAEDALFRSLAAGDRNFFARAVDRPLSRAISRRLVHTGITPNQITLVSMTLGIVGSLLLLHPSPLAAPLGTLLFLLSTIVDGCDGEVARLKFQETAFGARLDLIGDNVVHAVLFPCLAMRLWMHDGGQHFFTLGLVALGGAVASWLAVWRVILQPDPSPRAKALFAAFANREFAYLLFALALVGRVEWFVWAMVIGIWLFPILLVVLHAIDATAKPAEH